MAEKNLTGKKILVVIARKDFRDEEYFIPLEIWQKAGAEIITASSKIGTVIGVLGGEAEAVLDIKNAKAKDFDAVIFVGGSGSAEYFNSKEAHRIAKEFNEAKKTIGAICIAPVILAKAGILQGKTAAIWYDNMDKTGPNALREGGCFLSGNSVEETGNIITGNGRQASEEFAKAIARHLEK